MLSRKYNLINNLGGWLVFFIALITYWLTLEPTASYWDCGEFIIQADKLEVGHPPGNPIFMLTARFFANFASSPEQVSLMVNAMSGLLSALTILLMFWTITHLVRRLVVKDGSRECSLTQYLVIMGAGLVGSLAYCWSDTFWFSAVEGEVYAFSSFCTALVFWLILKWENRADSPHSDRYLVLIAYIIGVSVAVHLLNLLCIPAIVLIFVYRRFKDVNVVKSLIALLVSFVIIALVLFGLVPGFIKVAQIFELFFVNSCHMSFNSGALIYVFTTLLVFLWAIYELQVQKSFTRIRISFLLAVTLSGMLFMGSSIWIGLILTAALIALMVMKWKEYFSLRVLNIVMWSIAVIFMGYSSYALILIRSTADTPMNQNSPDNVFDLAAYLNREQYGQTPLLYGETLNSGQQQYYLGSAEQVLGQDSEGNDIAVSTPQYEPIYESGRASYAKGVKGARTSESFTGLTPSDVKKNDEAAARQGDYYVKTNNSLEAKNNPELNMFFPRIYSSMHRDQYAIWVPMDTVDGNMVELHAIDKATGEKVTEFDTYAGPQMNENTGQIYYPVHTAYKPTQKQNWTYFFNYQLNHMYMRYFMWNFAGRQNDLLNQAGELDAGNWISGIPFIDNARLGDQSYLPDELGKDNAGHNVYYMLPLLLGILGLLWQAFAGKRGIQQFWVVFFLFFMTGIAIVLYLNQPPNQPRERDYAFAGSFYAFAIWIGMGVPALWRILVYLLTKGKSAETLRKFIAEKKMEPEQSPAMTESPEEPKPYGLYCAAAAAVLCLFVPLQMVSQTWDDHDRSGRYAARDYGANYLESLEPNAIVFCNGDNDTFPLWYAQEVEGIRPDVKIVNLSYLQSDWYANQHRMDSYTAKGIKMTAEPKDYAYGNFVAVGLAARDSAENMIQALKNVYAGKSNIEGYPYPVIKASKLLIPVDKKKVLARGLVAAKDSAQIVDNIEIDFNSGYLAGKRYLTMGDVLMLDIIATNAANGWERPIYWACTVGPEYHVGLTPYLRSTGMTHQLVPTMQENMAPRTDRAYEVVTKKYRWGGADADADKAPYFDETASRMLASMRNSMIEVSKELIYEGDIKYNEGNKAGAQTDYKKALTVLDMMTDNLRSSTMKYSLQCALDQAQLYCELGGTKEMPRLSDKKLTQKGLKMFEQLIDRYAQYVVYNQMIAQEFLSPSLSFETKYAPLQFYLTVETYSKYGGNLKALEAKLKRQGIDLNFYKKQYEAYMNPQSGAGNGEVSEDEWANYIMELIMTVKRLQAMSAEEYAQAGEEDRQVDSVFYHFIEEYAQHVGGMDSIRRDGAFKGFDFERSKRLFDEFMAKHPDALSGN